MFDLFSWLCSLRYRCMLIFAIYPNFAKTTLTRDHETSNFSFSPFTQRSKMKSISMHEILKTKMISLNSKVNHFSKISNNPFLNPNGRSMLALHSELFIYETCLQTDDRSFLSLKTLRSYFLHWWTTTLYVRSRDYQWYVEFRCRTHAGLSRSRWFKCAFHSASHLLAFLRFTPAVRA